MELRKRGDPTSSKTRGREGADEKAEKVRCKYELIDYRIAEYDFCFMTELAYKAPTCRSIV